MLWLTFDKIKAQLRLDDEQAEYEHDLLMAYGEAAEEAVLDLIRRSYLNVLLTFGGIPKKLEIVSLMLVDNLYKERAPSSTVSLSTVPYSFDLLLKPLMRLTGEDEYGDVDLGTLLLDRNGLPFICSDGTVLCCAPE